MYYHASPFGGITQLKPHVSNHGIPLVAWIFGSQAAVWSRIVYTLVGAAGLWCISLLFRERSLLGDGSDAD